MPFYTLKGDLVKMPVDAIVNAANVNLKMVEGVGRAIFHAAGDQELTKACKDIGKCMPGNAVVTPSFNLTSTKMIIHAVAPIYLNGKHDEEKILRKTYNSVLNIALENGFKTIAFPLLGGEFNWPLRECFDIACDEIKKFIFEHDLDLTVYLVMYKNFPNTLSDYTQESLTRYITSHFKVNEKERTLTKLKIDFKYTYDKFCNNISDEELIKKANISSQTIYEIKNNPKFKPSKNLVIALALALDLSRDNLKYFLRDFNIILSNSRLFDLILLYFLDNNIKDIYKINNALFAYDFLPLGEKF